LLYRSRNGSIGYVESGFAQRLGLTAARLENAAGALLEPTPETARAALEAVTSADANALSVAVTDPVADNAYPLVTYSFWLQRKGDSARSAAMANLLQWVLTEGQALAEPLGYVALPDSISKAAVAEISGEAS
jgi:phosphate transport system substrate-binding protein